MNPTSTSPKVVLLANDLMLGSTVSGVASAAGLAYRNVGNETDAIAQAADAGRVLLLIDLGTAGLDIHGLAAGLPESVRQSAVAYGPHVHTAKLEAAVAAGIGSVVSRGQFSASVGRLVSDFGQSAAEDLLSEG